LGDEITITEEVIKAAAGNERSGKEVIVLLDRWRDKITIREEAAVLLGNAEWKRAPVSNYQILTGYE
jgi:hypothetical protein